MFSITQHVSPPKVGQRIFLGNLQGASQALAITEFASKHQGLTLVITTDTNSAMRLEDEIGFFSQTLPVLHFPDWEVLPYDLFSPHQDITSARISTLARLAQTKNAILIIPVRTLLHKLPPVEFYQSQSFALQKGDTFNPDETRKQLETSGYYCVETVYQHGEFALRGNIMDIFPMGEPNPFRIELFDDEIDTLRTFDTDTQRTLEKIEKIEILPAHEYPTDARGLRLFKQRWFDFFEQDPKECTLYKDITQGITSAGIEYYLPLFFENPLGHLFEHLPDNSLIIQQTGLEDAAKQFIKEVNERYESRRYNLQRPILPPAELFLNVDSLFAAIKHYPSIVCSQTNVTDRAGSENFATQALPDISVDARSQDALGKLKLFLNEHQDYRILFCADSKGRREAIFDLLKPAGIQVHTLESYKELNTTSNSLNLIQAPLDESVILEAQKCILITENQLFSQRIRQKRRRNAQQSDSDMIIRDLAELKEGTPVVHLDHGIGRYMGLQTLEAGGETNEFLVLIYAKESKLYVPVSSLHLISRYAGSEDSKVNLSNLGTEKWAQAKRKAIEKVRDSAAELLDIYAKRQAKKGFAFDKPNEDYQRFAASFPFEETPDQQSAIDAVIKDMCAPQPMDRLVCGDVGFGKTEVAMRAAFMAVQSGKQVAVLVPTTLLAQQHFENFSDRFADWPVKVEVLSRFKSAKETQATLERMLDGQADIVIGTHKLIQKDIRFNRLSLLIIDEEHRFGVQQKEKIKALRTEVDILTLTATPIPRTLNLSMSGVRDLSIIATPPAKRLSVNTFVKPYDSANIKEAVLREILRGGQLYYLHNEVKTIERCARELEELIPEARVGIAHGQMSERELEQVMGDFYHKRFNTLVCTTIIETGIDIPSANTIIIERADKFGLAQLHQLRGRVGRSHHQAYAYMLTPQTKISKDAEKRLDAIVAAQDLGAGFMLATHDLEIRGAGELLGEEQSGQIETVGFTLYMDMLNEEVEAIKNGKQPDYELHIQSDAEVNLHAAALIPDNYLPDVNLRLNLYKRIASSRNEVELKTLQVEMIDRFGLLPEQVKTLFKQTLLKLNLNELGIKKLDAGENSGRIEFREKTPIDPFSLIQLVQSRPQSFKLDGSQGLRFYATMTTIEERFEYIEKLLDTIKPAS